MRPLIEILEDERRLTHKLEALYRLLMRDDDVELLTMIHAKQKNVEQDLGMVRLELREYLKDLLE
jgi:hypothetical protein